MKKTKKDISAIEFFAILFGIVGVLLTLTFYWKILLIGSLLGVVALVIGIFLYSKKGKSIVTLIPVVLGIIAIINLPIYFFIILPKNLEVKENDIEILGFEWNACAFENIESSKCNESPIYYSNGVKGEGNLIIYSHSEDSLYIDVYAESKKLIEKWYVFGRGEKRIPVYDFEISSQESGILFKICWYKEFQNYMKGIVCKEKEIPLPKILIEVYPNPLVFRVKREFVDQLQNIKATLFIRNVGEIPVNLEIILPNSYEMKEYNRDYPQYYYPPESSNRIFIKAGETKPFNISLSLPSNISPGTYVSEGILYFPPQEGIGNVLYRMKFELQTIVE